MRKKKILVLSILLIFALLFTAACGSQPAADKGGDKAEGEKDSGATEKVTEVKVGAIYPVTGSSAATGRDLKNGIDLALEIINGEHPELNLPLAKDAGLPNLGGAKIKVTFADHQGSPEKGQSEAERLITQEKVDALIGSYYSSVTGTASQVAERYRVPFVNPESTSPTLTQRGFKWFFRTTPDDDLFAKNFFQFLDDMKAKGLVNAGEDKLAIVYENSEWGANVGKFENKYAEEFGYQVATDLNYNKNATEVTTEVQSIKKSGASIILQASYVSDAILFTKTYSDLNLNFDGLLAMDAGFIAPEFLDNVGGKAEYILSREVWALDLGKSKPLVKQVNDMFKEKYGTNMNGNSARSFTGMLVLADAINRAGSTDKDAIRQALIDTDISADQIIMPWKGIKFDLETHQNTLGQGIIVQVQDGQYKTVWPWDLASTDLVWPTPKWSER